MSGSDFYFDYANFDDSQRQDSDFYIDYANLDDFQRQLIDRRNNRSMVVTGTAGSGKSLIALHKAKQLASTGESYVIIVYTKTLRKYFEDGMRALGLKNIYHYHHWRRCSEKTKVKYMIVDECQDFTREEIEEIRRYGDYCFFFGDTAQSIMGFREPTIPVEETAYLLGVAPEQLYFNYRLTRDIARLGESVGIVDDLELRCKRDGEKPNLILAPSFDAQLDRIAEVITNRSLTNVGILLPFNKEEKGYLSVEYVKNYLRNKGIPCEFKYNDNQETEMDLNFHSNNPKIMTWWCAKGLQFKDVFIPGCETAFSPKWRAALYVAMTRCSERLYISYTGNLCRFFPDPSSSIYNTAYDDEVI